MLKEAEERSERWLSTDQPDDAFGRYPLHWPLAFPEVFGSARPGFDAIIGNPPFLGGFKIRDSVGESYKDLIVTWIGHGVRGNRGASDLIAYFTLRAHSLLTEAGQTGLVATNSIAQGDTRTVGLDQIVALGVTIRQAVKSEPWPSRSATLEYAAIWTSREALEPKARRMADGIAVHGITSSLDASSRVVGRPYTLQQSMVSALQGMAIIGDGFLVDPERASELIGANSRNRDVLFAYLNGKDVNTRPDSSASRWVINFHNWDESRAKSYPECYEQVYRLVRPERANNKVKSRREKWWLYSEYRRSLVESTAALDQVIVMAIISKTVMPVIVPTGQVFAHKLVVFPTDNTAALALLSSAPHYWWAITRSSTMKADLNYSLADAFATLVWPELTNDMRDLGNRLHFVRRDLLLARQAGLTATYNLVHDPKCADADIAQLRSIHRSIDGAVVQAYGWDDLLAAGLEHGFHETRQGIRYTVGPVVRQEILDRLLDLNHERYAAEVKAGLHDKRGRKPSAQASDSTLF